MDIIEFTVICVLGLYALDAAPSCAEDQHDIWTIAKARQQGLTKDDLLMFLDGSRAELTPERMIAIRALIEDAYQWTPAQAEGWWSMRRTTCPMEDEA